jgi:alkaline phosphatase D
MKKLWLIFYLIPILFAQANTSEKGPIHLEIGDLAINSLYGYRFVLNSYVQPVAQGSSHTKNLWQCRKPASDFSFLTGSCAYFNEPIYDRPGKPYGGISEKQLKP